MLCIYNDDDVIIDREQEQQLQEIFRRESGQRSANRALKNTRCASTKKSISIILDFLILKPIMNARRCAHGVLQQGDSGARVALGLLARRPLAGIEMWCDMIP